MAYHLSRSSGDPTVILSILKRHILAILSEETSEELVGVEEGETSTSNADPLSPVQEDPAVPQDPLPKKLRHTVNSRLKNDLILCVFTAVVVFLIVQSDVFAKTHPHIDLVLWILAVLVGLVLHYFIPHLRKENPWKCIACPLLKSNEYG